MLTRIISYTDTGVPMNILYAGNESYMEHIAVSICSLYETHKKLNNLQVYLISTGITELSKHKLTTMAGRYKRHIHILELDNLKDRFDYEVYTDTFDISVMARLFMAELLPRSVKRILYLDGDTVILRSLNKLWNTELKDNIIAAALEPTINKQIKLDIGIGYNWAYYNSGVMLINLEHWRHEAVLERILNYYANIRKLSLFSDQDAINGALAGRIKPISPGYNFLSNYKFWSYNALCRLSGFYKMIPKNEFTYAKKHPHIVHFAGDERPWIEGNFNFYRQAYYRYKALTPWSNTPKLGGRRIYMLAYHILNLITCICPEIRCFISDMYIEKKRRKRLNL